MKIKHFTLFAIILIISSCSSVSYLSATSKSDKKAVKTFLKEIKEVVINKHYTVLMTYMDSDYLKAQHEGFLIGNDLQFINEIFCGNDITDGSHHCIEQKEIIHFEIREITQVEDSKYKALFEVGNGTNKVNCKLLLSKKTIGGVAKFGIMGAIG
jgi:hypothetical protein